jgi:hypothetical protein
MVEHVLKQHLVETCIGTLRSGTYIGKARDGTRIRTTTEQIHRTARGGTVAGRRTLGRISSGVLIG